MLVKNWMSKPAITIDANASMNDAIKLLKESQYQNAAGYGKGQARWDSDRSGS